MKAVYCWTTERTQSLGLSASGPFAFSCLCFELQVSRDRIER